MFRPAWTAVVVVASAIWVAGARPAAQTPSLDALFSTYASGNYQILQTTLRSRQDFLAVMFDAPVVVDQWRRAWDPAHATFLLEMANQVQPWPGFVGLVLTARDLVIHRADPVGAKPIDDQFEITFHRAAVAFLCGAGQSFAAEVYLDSIRTRVVPAPRAEGPLQLVDPRLTLARAVLHEIRTKPAATAPVTLFGAVRNLQADNAGERRSLDEALHAFDEALKYPDVAAEAAVRQGFLLYRLGRSPEALQTLAGVPASASREVRYWDALFRGRALEALQQTDAAANAYEQAAALAPDAQTPAVALASLRTRQDRLDDAVHWASVARTRPTAAVDPWWQYWTGDLRFVPVWLSALRRVHG